MQYLVIIPAPHDAMIVIKGKLKLNPKYPAKTQPERLQEINNMVAVIIKRFPSIQVLNTTPAFAVIETTEETAKIIREELGYTVAPNRRLPRPPRPRPAK